MKNSERYLIFNVGGECFAMPLLKVREVIAMPELTNIPQAPPHVVGIINLRGQIITIFDLCSCLNSQKKADQPTVIIVEMPFGQIGLIVDSVSMVLEAHADKISEVPPGSKASHNDLIENVYAKDDTLILMLDIEKLFSREVKILAASPTEVA